MYRRRFLGLAGLAAVTGVGLPVGAVAGGDPLPPAPIGRGTPKGPFSVRMPVPPTLRPVARTDDTDVYRLDVLTADLELVPGVRTSCLTYGGSFVGPTIRAREGRRVLVTYRNRLPEAVNVHLHGGHVPADSDGHPMQLIDPGGERRYEYPNRQPGATLWYHDHSHHAEAEHVYRGLHAFYLIEGEDERRHDLPRDEYDVPIAIRDAEFDAAGQLVHGDPAKRNVILVNGRSKPYFPVAARKYRLRLLNSSTLRFLKLNFGSLPVLQIGSDGGLLPAPVDRTGTDFPLAAGERVDLVVDFSGLAVGSRAALTNQGQYTGDDRIEPVLQFAVDRRARDRSGVPAVLRPLPELPPATVHRELTLSFDLNGTPTGLVNGLPFDPDRVDQRVRRGATEIWTVTNGDSATKYGPIQHSFHLHLAQFRVLDRDGRPPLPGDAGLKDTVPLPPGTSVRVQATFTDYLGRYMYHCHMLEHSSAGMMGQMEIVD
ncbi:multicopper oxidase family protein [Kitasatospora sp. NPDC127116]|uniref:multicopper oxidase family protein n=1 Tax=Kitasatospora sp. NPDC127116 TaxID=3345367 RepID=UPI00337A0A4E